MYLEPNLWKSLKAKTDLIWKPAEHMLHLLMCSLWGFLLGERSRLSWSFHPVPQDINPCGTSSPGKLETGETYHCCQDIVSVARSPNRIRFKVLYWCDECSTCGLDWGGRLILGLGSPNVSSVLISVTSLVPASFHVDTDLLLFCWHFHDGLGVLANKGR